MSSTPDPNYWGNPPITPTAASGPQPNARTQQPNAASAPQPAESSQPTASPQPTANMQQPPAQEAGRKRRTTGIIIAVGVVVLLAVCLFVGGCTAIRSLAGQIATGTTPQGSSPATEQDDATLQNNTEYLNENLRETFNLGEGGEALGTAEIEELKSSSFASQSTTRNADGGYDAGVYYVGQDLPAGEYWFYGADDQVSLYYILEPADQEGAYNVKFANSYYGHNIMAVEEGQVLIAYNPEGLLPLSQMNKTFTSPYTNGVFRVGTDIPAGVYELSGGKASDYSAFYVMSDLQYSDSSITDSQYFLPGEDPDATVVLKEGTYVELYNMTLTPAGKAA